jgi:predicted Zn finger-like uncharacterized protein
MYTQCPDCNTAFRVTAEVLKQAAGKVRCGGCGVAFNALEFLSEQMPARPAPKKAEVPLPELTPEPPPQDVRAPMAVSDAQSAALLKTLDELAGSDIRIEDTGIEWRVMDDDDVTAGDFDLDIGASALGIDEILDESPTPVDQFLTKTPNNIDASEIFEESANAPARAPVEELRFDDNTPLPDDFDTGDETSAVNLAQTEVVPQSEHPRDVDEAPVDIALGDPDEWADILGEFAEPHEPFVPPLDAELAALEKDPPEDDAGSAPAMAADSDAPPDMDTQFALQAEAMGIDLSGLHAAHDDAAEEHAIDDRPEEAVVATEPETPEAVEPKPAFDAPAHAEDDATELQLADDTGAVPELAGEDESEETGEVPALELADASGHQLQLEDVPPEQSGSWSEADAGQVVGRASEEAQSGVEYEVVDEAPLEFGSMEGSIAKAMAELEEQSDVFDKSFFAGNAGAEPAKADASDDEQTTLQGESDDDEFPDEGQFVDHSIELDDELEASEPATDEDAQHVVPPQTEEELTLNRLIDQELLSMAIEDEDGYTSTIAVGGEDPREASAEIRQPRLPEDTGAGFESIIMEGEFVRTALDEKKRKADIAEAAALAEQARQAREAETRASGSGNRHRMAAAAALLALLLVVQVLHQSREALATIPVFKDTVGPLYRAIGMPLSPAWDVTGWRFEARRDILDEEADTLTVISRIGNTSAKPLPYPLINISLTDRFEETVGTKTLEPADYLRDDLDAGKMVHPGNNFTAVMTIESPAVNATGYKLQACYRQLDAQLRCHIPNFK